MKRRKRRRVSEDVELNLAAMLDMAFQLLAFFILTFQPSPMEGQVLLHLPPPSPVTSLPKAQDAGDDPDNLNPIRGLDTVVISVMAAPSGQISSMAIGESVITNVNGLALKLNTLFGEPGVVFDQVLIQASADLSYQSLMDVIDVCTRVTLPGGKRLSKLSFVDLDISSSGAVPNATQ